MATNLESLITELRADLKKAAFQSWREERIMTTLPSDLAKWRDQRAKQRCKILKRDPIPLDEAMELEYILGGDELFAKLCESGPEFNEIDAIEEFCKISIIGERMNRADLYKAGARWQHEQSRAREAALFVEKKDYDALLEQVRMLRSTIIATSDGAICLTSCSHLAIKAFDKFLDGK